MLIFEAEVLQPFYVDVVAAVRAEAPAWVAFLEPASSRNLGVATGLVKLPFGDVVYSPHSYDRDAEGGSGFDPAHRDAILDNLAALAAEARSLDAALWIGEYGGVASAPGITAYMDAQYDGAAAVVAGAMYWDYGRDDGYAMLASDGSEKAELLDVLVRPWPERVAGDPVSIAYDEAASRLEVTYRPDRRSAAPTEIAVPERRYPGGYAVECGGCETERAPGLLRVLTAPAGEVVSVIVTP